MKSRFASLRAKLALLILCLIITTTGAAVIALQNIGKGALIRIGDSQSRLVQGALLDEWEKTAIANGKLLARSLVSHLAALDASAMVRISSLAMNEPGVAYVFILSRTGQVLADGTDELESVGKVLTDRLSRSAMAANKVVLRNNGELVDVAVPIRLGPERLGTVRIGYSPDHILGAVAMLKRQVRAAMDRAGQTTLYGFAGIMAVAGAALFVVGLFIARSFVSPLGALVRASRSFGAGDLATRSGLPPGNDEIGELAAAFDEMMGHIESHAGGLERLLEQRTRDLRESEARLRSIMDNANTEIMLKDLDGRFLTVNRLFERNNSITAEQVAGKTLAELYSPEEAAPIEALERRVIETGQALQQEISPIRRPGTGWYLNTKFPVRNSAGGIVAIGTINTDITESKRAQEDLRAAHDGLEARVEQRARELRDSEERYRQLVNLSPDGIMVHADGVVVFANPTLVDLLGADSANQIIGRDAIDFVPEDDRAAVLERRRSASERTMHEPRETTYRRLDGSLIPVERAIARITWQGKPAFLVLTRDITDRTRREEQLRQAQKMEAVGQLTGGIAHDFNNLLTVVLGYFDLLKKNAVDAASLDRMADTANSAARKGADLTQRLLAFARRQPLRPQSVDVGRLAADMEELIRRTLGAAITIRTESEPGMWPCVVDSAQLENSLLNLCLNARDAMQDGGELVIRTRNVELDEPSARRIGDLSAGRYIVLSVMDDGHGMTREIAARVFEPFFTTKTEERGTGLGLSMVYGFVRQSGGDVRILSVPDGGTTVELYLPASEDVAAEEFRAVAAEIPTAAVSGTEKVLVVEDDPGVRDLGVSMLSALGYGVVAAPDGPAALSVLEMDGTVDLLFTDVVMPGGMSGPDLVRRARELHPAIKVVLTSGYPRTDDDGPDLGTDELLPKPYSNVQLAACIRRVLDGGSAQ